MVTTYRASCQNVSRIMLRLLLLAIILTWTIQVNSRTFGLINWDFRRQLSPACWGTQSRGNRGRASSTTTIAPTPETDIPSPSSSAEDNDFSGDYSDEDFNDLRASNRRRRQRLKRRQNEKKKTNHKQQQKKRLARKQSNNKNRVKKNKKVSLLGGTLE